MKELNVTNELKEKINSIFNAGEEARILAVRETSIDAICEIVAIEECGEVLEIILERLEVEKDTEEVKGNYQKLAKAKSWEIREFVAKKVPIEIGCEMVANEEYSSVSRVILERLETAKDTEEVKDNYKKLAKAKSCKIREFVAKDISIETVCEMAVNEEDIYVLKVILERLEAAKDTEEVKSNYKKLAKAKSWEIREFIAKNIPIETGCEMVANEEFSSVPRVILERLEATKDTEKIKENYPKLAKAKSCKIRRFVAKNIPIETVCEMAVNEENIYVLKVILERLEAAKDTEEVKGNYSKLAKAKSCKIRRFVAKNIPIEAVCEMAANEKDIDVLKVILERLEAAKDTEEVKGNYTKLAKAKSYKIHEFVAKKAQIEIICEMAMTEEGSNVIEVILERLEATNDTEEVKSNYKKLAKAKSWGIREFVAKDISIEIVCEMAVNEENIYVLKVILERLEAAKDTEEVKGNYTKLAKAKSYKIHEFVAKKAQIEIICEMAMTEEGSNVIDVILERLEATNDTEEVKGNYQKLAKAKSYIIREVGFSIMPIEELRQIVESKGNGCVVKLIKEINEML